MSLLGEQLRLAVEIALGVDDRDLGLGRLGLRLGIGGARVLDVGAGPLDLRLLIQHRGLGRLDVGLRLIDLGREDVRVDPRDDLVLLHDRVEVDQEVFDLAGNLAPDLHRDDRVEIAGGRDRGGEGTALDADRPEFGDAAAALGVEVAPHRTPHQQGDDDEGNDPLHQLIRRSWPANCFLGLSGDQPHDPASRARSGSRPGPGFRCSAPG